MKKLFISIALIFSFALQAEKTDFKFKFTNNSSRDVYFLFNPINEVIKADYFRKLGSHQTTEDTIFLNNKINVSKDLQQPLILYVVLDQLPNSPFAELHQFIFSFKNKNINLQLNQIKEKETGKGFVLDKENNIILSAKGSGLLKGKTIKNSEIKHFRVLGASILGDQRRDSRRSTIHEKD